MRVNCASISIEAENSKQFTEVIYSLNLLEGSRLFMSSCPSVAQTPWWLEARVLCLVETCRGSSQRTPCSTEIVWISLHKSWCARNFTFPSSPKSAMMLNCYFCKKKCTLISSHLTLKWLFGTWPVCQLEDSNI